LHGAPGPARHRSLISAPTESCSRSGGSDGGAIREWRDYGTDVAELEALVRAEPELGEPLHPDLSNCGAEIVFGVRHEMARDLEDALSRRTRALLLNAAASVDVAPRVATLMAAELGRDAAWERAQVKAFKELAAGYRIART